jgi:hypothetical protein
MGPTTMPGTDDPAFEAWKRAKRAASHPPTGDDAAFEAWKAARGNAPGGHDALHDYHAEYASGALQRRTEEANAADAASVSASPEPFSVGGALATSFANAARGIPGVGALQNVVRAATRGESYREAKADIDTATGRIPSLASKAQRFTGAVPAAALVPEGAVAGGATLGAADAALSDDPTLSAGDRVAGGVIGAGTGAAGGKLLRGLGNAATRSGLTDAVGAGLRKVGGVAADIGESLGVEGAANKLMAARQAILARLSGSDQSAAQTMLEHVDHYKGQAKTLYDAAKQDATVVNNPRVQRVLADPRVQQMFQVARERLGLGPNETVIQAGSPEIPRLLPGPRVPEPAPVPSDAPTSTREAIRAFQQRGVIAGQRTEGTVAQQTARAALERRAAEASLPTPAPSIVGASLVANPKAATPEITADLPTPEELAMTKRLLGLVVQQKFNAPQGITSAEAAQLAPLLDDLRSALHEASPAWKDADAFYSQAKNFETAFQKAYGAAQKPTASGLDPSKLRTPEAVTAWVAKKAGTPTGIARASGQQAGTAARLSESLRNAPIGLDIGQTLEGANGVFQPSASAAALRRPAFPSDDAARQFSDALGTAVSDAQRVAASRGPQSVPLLKPWKALTPNNPLATPAGIRARMALAERLSTPAGAASVRAATEAAERGELAKMAIVRALLAGGNATLQ